GLGPAALACALAPVLPDARGAARAGRPAPDGQGKDARKSSGPGRILVWRQGRLGTVPPDGKGFQWLTGDTPDVRVSPDAQLSPDGKLVVYGVQVENFQGPGDIPRKLYVRGVSDKKGDDLDVQGIVWRWSPDGRRLAVAAFTGGRAEHWLV